MENFSAPQDTPYNDGDGERWYDALDWIQNEDPENLVDGIGSLLLALLVGKF